MTTGNPLELSGDDMRRLGARAMEMVVRHVETNRDAPVSRTMARADTERLLRTPLPEAPTPVDELLTILERDVFTAALRTDHPRFYAFVPSPTNFVSIVGDLLTSGHNLFAGHWMAASGAAQVEITVIDWLNALVGYPQSAGGILVSGGSMANLTAIATAREVKLGGPDEHGIVYCSDQTHSSLAKGLRVLGFRAKQKRTVATDDGLRISLGALETAIRDDRIAGRVPFCVVANAGTTNTGAVDPLGPLADLCAREGLWLHVDGAYGAASVITDRGRAALAGIERADSVTLDPHKWLFQPYELGCLLMRDDDHLRRAFRLEDDDHAEYLVDVVRHVQRDVNFYEHGVQLTRSFKALKLWLSLRTFGLPAFREAVEVGFALAECAERELRKDLFWEVVTPAQMGIVTFRPACAPGDEAATDRATTRAVDLMREDAYALVMSTTLRGRPTFRLCPMHPGGREEEIRETLRRLKKFVGVAAKGG